MINDDLKAAEGKDYSKAQGDLEQTKAALKASLKKNKGGRTYVDADNNTRQLNDQQEYFCKLMADGRNQTDAARLAYPNDSRPSERGYELNQKPHIKERVELLKHERAYAAKAVDPQESLIRWNEIYMNAMEKGDIKVAIEAQKQIDKINGAETFNIKQQLEVKGMFRGEDEDEWQKSAKRLSQLIAPQIENRLGQDS